VGGIGVISKSVNVLLGGKEMMVRVDEGRLTILNGGECSVMWTYIEHVILCTGCVDLEKKKLESEITCMLDLNCGGGVSNLFSAASDATLQNM